MRFLRRFAAACAAVAYPTHVWVGQWYGPVATRKNVTGLIPAPATVFWGIEKKGS